MPWRNSLYSYELRDVSANPAQFPEPALPKGGWVATVSSHRLGRADKQL